MNISNNFPMPKNAKVRCTTCHAVTDAECQAPIRCQECGSTSIVWMKPPAPKIKMTGHGRPLGKGYYIDHGLPSPWTSWLSGRDCRYAN